MDLGLGYLFAQYPFLDWWPLNSFIKWLLGDIEGKLWQGITTLVNVEYVPFKNAVTQKKYADSIQLLRQSAISDGINSPAYQAVRKQNALDFAAHVRSLLVKAA